tara:strand:- start:47422 stop:47784 length:363 start_codon:yes stop_codon:yes gene_type:complete
MSRFASMTQIGDVLVVSINEDLPDGEAELLLASLTQKVDTFDARGVLIDVSALDIVDTFLGQVLGHLAKTMGIMGAETVLVGMQPAVASTLVELGMTLPDLRCALTITRAMAMLKKREGR